MNRITEDAGMAHDDLPLDARIEPLFDQLFSTPLTEMQKQGIRFMVQREEQSFYNQRGGLNCSPLGVGKTLTTLGCMAVQKYIGFPGRKQLTIILAPASVIHTWAHQVQEHLVPGTLEVHLYHGANRRDKLTDARLAELDAVITSYSTLVYDAAEPGGLIERAAPIARLVMDEAHSFRNPETQLFNTVKDVDAEIRWCITATPIWNSLDDLWALLHVLRAEPLNHRVSWLLETKNDDGFFRPQFVQRVLLPRLTRFLRPITLRQNKTLLNLPPKEEAYISVPMAENERLFYETLYENSREKMSRLLEIEQSLRSSHWARALRQRANMSMMNIFLRMRQACVHPQVVLDAFERGRANDNSGSNLPRSPSGAELFQMAVERLRREEIEENCAVCMDRVPDHAAVPCGHRFCADCFGIMRAMVNNQQSRFLCPMCRRQVERYDHVEAILEAGAASVSVSTLDPPVSTSDPPVPTSALSPDPPLERPMWPSSCSKLEWVWADMNQRPADVKFVVFSQWVTVLDQVERFFGERGVRFLRVDGSMSLKKRAEHQKEFHQNDAIRVLLVSLMAGGQGLNLQRASVVYHLDAWWTASRTDQASNRVYRLGQNRETTIVHLLAEQSVEQAVFQIQNNKRDLGRQLFHGGGYGSVQQEIRRAFQL